MKRILCVLIAILMMLSLTVPAFAADEVKAISTSEDLVKLLIFGGKGKLENDINITSKEIVSLIDDFEEPINPKAEIDLNDMTLTFGSNDTLNFEDVVWVFRNGTFRASSNSNTGLIKLSNSIVLLEKTDAKFTYLFSDDSNITLFLLPNSICSDSSNKPYAYCYRTSDTTPFKYDRKPMSISLDGGTINLDSFNDVTFKDGYAELDSVIPQKSKEKFLGWKAGRACWTTQFVITFDPGEGTCDTKSLATLYGGALGIKQLPIASKDGYCFVGWFEEGSNQKVTVDTVFEKDTTLHAKLVAKEEQIKNIEKPMKDLGFGEADVQKVISLFSSNKVAGSAIVSEPVWGVVIAALVVGAFAGGTAFGSKRNKKD